MIASLFVGPSPARPAYPAYLLVGERPSLLTQLRPYLGEDWLLQEAVAFGINESRQLKRWQQQGASGERRYFVVSCQTMTLEAQNALLKTLEEPVPGHYFFLLVESLHGFLPTLLSRLQVLTIASNRGGAVENDLGELTGKKFWSATYETRLALLSKFLAASESKAATKTAALALLAGWERHLHQAWQAHPTDPALTNALTTLAANRDYLHDPAALPKLILEHLALTMPISDV